MLSLMVVHYIFLCQLASYSPSAALFNSGAGALTITGKQSKMNALEPHKWFRSVKNLVTEKETIPGTSTTLVGGFEENLFICK